MKTIVVAYKAPKNIDNHFCMFPSAIYAPLQGEKVRLVFHDNPICKMQGGRQNTNYDMCVITDTNDAMNYKRAILLPRISKVLQSAMLLEQKDSSNHFHHIQTWDSPHDFNNTPESIELNNIIFKHGGAARGIAQLLLKNVKGVNKYSLFKRFRETIEDIKRDIVKKAFEERDLEFVNQLAKDRFAATFGENAIWSGIDQKDVSDALELFESVDYHAQEYLPNIVGEYRVITQKHENKFIYYQRKMRKNRGFPQATGADEMIIVDRPKGLSDSAAEDLESILEYLPNMNSVDIAVLEDDDNYKFAILEFCNQFGIEGVDPKIVQQQHIEFLITHAKRFNIL